LFGHKDCEQCGRKAREYRHNLQIQIYDRGKRPADAAPNCAFRNSVPARLRWILSQSVRQHCNRRQSRTVPSEICRRRGTFLASFRRKTHGASWSSWWNLIRASRRRPSAQGYCRFSILYSTDCCYWPPVKNRCGMAILTRETVAHSECEPPGSAGNVFLHTFARPINRRGGSLDGGHPCNIVGHWGMTLEDSSWTSSQLKTKSRPLTTYCQPS
jgi:hypothetical protein